MILLCVTSRLQRKHSSFLISPILILKSETLSLKIYNFVLVSRTRHGLLELVHYLQLAYKLNADWHTRKIGETNYCCIQIAYKLQWRTCSKGALCALSSINVLLPIHYNERTHAIGKKIRAAIDWR